MSFLNYFTDRERGAAARANRLKTGFAGLFAPLLERLRIPPDAVSYAGLAMLVGVVIWFVAHPYRTVVMLILYLLTDAVDGGYARYLNRPSQSGAFTDVVVDQLGMVVISLGFIYYDFVGPQVGAYYIMIYIVMITFAIIQNAQGIPVQYILRTKYILYAIYAFWAFFKINLAQPLMPLFNAVMTISCIQSYLRLKYGLYEKYDAGKIAELDQERIAQGQKPLHFIPLWNYLLPAGVILLLAFLAAYTQIATLLARPDVRPRWEEVNTLPLADRHEQAQSAAAFRDGFVVSTFDGRNRFSRIYFLRGPSLHCAGSFGVPWELSRDHGLCANRDEVFVVDKLSRRVLALDLDKSMEQRIAAATKSFDTTLQAPVACAFAQVEGRERMLVAEHMHTHTTIALDYEAAFRGGTAKGYIVAWYRNAGFAHALAGNREIVLEADGSLLLDVIYEVNLASALNDKYIRTGMIGSFTGPGMHCTGIAFNRDIFIALDGEKPYRTLWPAQNQ